MLKASEALAMARANQSDQSIQAFYTEEIFHYVTSAAQRGYTGTTIPFDNMSKKRKQICEKLLLDAGYKIVHTLETAFVVEWG